MIMDAGLKVSLRVLIPAVENSVAGDAFRPLDVYPSRKGLNVEIGNTDAEGRLVLADALALADEETPDLLVDMGTLTGAARVALGPELPPYYTDDEALAAEVARHAAAENDPLWRLPLWRRYDQNIDSKVADVNNVAAGGMAGSIICALFLKRFVSAAKSWLHFDIYAWTPSAKPGPARGRRMPGGARALCAAERTLRLIGLTLRLKSYCRRHHRMHNDAHRERPARCAGPRRPMGSLPHDQGGSICPPSPPRTARRSTTRTGATGQPVVFSHGWPLSADAFEDQMFFLASHGYRCIAHDRRGHGRSSQPWNGNDLDTYADDLAELIEKLDLQGRDPRRPLDRRRRGRALHRPPRHEARRQGRADRRDPAADAEDRGQSRRPADRGVRRAPRRRRRRPLAVLEGPEHAVLRLQPAGREDLGGRARVVLAAGHDGRLPGVATSASRPSPRPTSPRT